MDETKDLTEYLTRAIPDIRLRRVVLQCVANQSYEVAKEALRLTFQHIDADVYHYCINVYGNWRIRYNAQVRRDANLQRYCTHRSASD
jgi:hypothetical protein